MLLSLILCAVLITQKSWAWNYYHLQHGSAGLRSRSSFPWDVVAIPDASDNHQNAAKASQLGLLLSSSSSGTRKDKVRKKHPGYYTPSEAVTNTVETFCKQMLPGSYGNPMYNCSVYHLCQDNGDWIQYDTMPCPESLRFNDHLGVCDWPANVDPRCNAVTIENHKEFREELGPKQVAAVDQELQDLDIKLLPVRRYAESRFKDRISRIPYYLRFVPGVTSTQSHPSSQRLPYLQVNYPRYLGYRRPKQITNTV